MNNNILMAIENYSMLSCGDRVIVALSGGADSVTLLDVICSLKEKYNLKIYAAHLNHMLRGEEAERDENFCKMICKNYGVELFVKKVNIKLLAKQQKISEELCGRNERYSFFSELSCRLSAKIATAHTASDNAETLIYNIARGSSVRGLGAIPPVRENIIRPLISCTRNQIEDYCREHNLKYVTDSTNLTDDYTRNGIRHNIIPQLKAVNPQVEAAFSRLSCNAREILELLDSQTGKALNDCKTLYGYSCKTMLSQNTAVLKNMIAKICSDKGFDIESRHIDLVINIIKNGGAVELGKNCTLVSKQGILRFDTKNDIKFFEPLIFENGAEFEYNNQRYNIHLIDADSENLNSVSADFLGERVVFRRRRHGDKFTCPRRKITKPLRKLFNEMKIPAERRDDILLLAKDSTVLWCEGIGVSLQGKNNSDKEFLVESKIITE